MFGRHHFDLIKPRQLTINAAQQLKTPPWIIGGWK
jgi:hypothetical protein